MLIKKMPTCLVIIIVLMTVSGPALAMGWMNLSDAYIRHLDGDAYRFRAVFDWGGPAYVDPQSGYVVDPVLDHLMIGNILGQPIDWTYNHTGAMGYSYAGDWWGGVDPIYGTGGAAGLAGPEFGWDFIYGGPAEAVFSMSYRGVMAWQEYDPFSGQIYGRSSEEFVSDFEVALYSAIPEPGTVLLLGLGLTGLGFIRRQR